MQSYKIGLPLTGNDSLNQPFFETLAKSRIFPEGETPVSTDKCLLNLIKNASRQNRLLLALDLFSLLNLSKSMDIAIQMASLEKNYILAEKMGAIKEVRFSESVETDLVEEHSGFADYPFSDAAASKRSRFDETECYSDPITQPKLQIPKVLQKEAQNPFSMESGKENTLHLQMPKKKGLMKTIQPDLFGNSSLK